MRGETPQGCTKARAGDDSIEEKKKTGKKWDYMIKIAKAFRIVKLAKAGSVPESTNGHGVPVLDWPPRRHMLPCNCSQCIQGEDQPGRILNPSGCTQEKRSPQTS